MGLRVLIFISYITKLLKSSEAKLFNYQKVMDFFADIKVLKRKISNENQNNQVIFIKYANTSRH